MQQTDSHRASNRVQPISYSGRRTLPRLPASGLLRSLRGGTGFVLACVAAQFAIAQSYPDRPIRMVVPFAAGGGADYSARPLAQKLTESLGQPVVIDNRGGANGAIGTEIVMQSKPDGYTLLYGAAGVITTGPVLDPKLKYNPERDFLPVALTVDQPYCVIMHPGLGVRSLKELLSYARANPAKLQFGSSGIGGAPHLAGELFKSAAKADIVHVAYRGVGPMLTDLLAGRIELAFVGINVVQQHVSTGKLLALATTGDKRSSNAPDVPTVAESGLPGFKAGGWYGVFAPAGTPREIVMRLNAAINHAAALPDIKERLADAAVPGNTPEQFAAFLKAERQKYENLIRTAKIKPE